MPASVGCRGGCTSPAALPAAGVPRPLPPSPRPALPPGLPCPVPPVPWGPCPCPCPCPWAPFRSRAHVAGPASRPPHPGPLALPSPLAQPLRLGTLPAPLNSLPVPWPLPGPLPESRVPSLVHHAPARSLSHHPSLRPLHLGPLPALPCALPVPRPLPCPLPVTPSAAPFPLAAAPFLDHSPGVPLPLQLRQRDARRRALALRGAVVPLPPRGEGLGGVRLGGAGVGVGGVGVGAVPSRSPCPLLLLRRPPARRPRPCGVLPPLARRAGGRSPSRALRTLLRCRGGRRRGARGRGRRLSHILLGLRCCRGGRRRGAHGPCRVRRNPSCALPALLRSCGSPRRRVRLLRRGCPPCRRCAGGRGRGRGVARRGLRLLRVRAGRGGGAGRWAAGAAVSAGPGPGPAAAVRPPPPPPASAPRAPRGSPPSTLGRRRGSGSRDRRWWRSSRPRDPSESAITVTLVGMRGGRRALPTTSWCISAVPWAVPCGALRGGGGRGVGGRLWRQPRTAGGSAAIHRHWEGRRGSHAAHASRHSSQSGTGLRALGPRGSSSGAGGSRTRWTPVTAVTSCVRRKVCIPSRAAGAGRGGRGYRCGPVEVGGGDPQDPPRAPAGRDDEEEEGGARALLPEDLPPVVGTPGPGEGGGQVWVSPARGACVAGGRAGHQVGSLGNASQTTAYGGVGPVPSYTGLVGRGRVGASSAPSTNTVISPTSRSSSGRV